MEKSVVIFESKYGSTKRYAEWISKELSCALADPCNEKNIENIKKSLKKALTPEMQAKIKVFHFRGGIDYSRLGMVHKFLMETVSKKDKDTLTAEEKQLMDTYGKTIDFTDKTAIQPLVDCVRK